MAEEETKLIDLLTGEDCSAKEFAQRSTPTVGTSQLPQGPSSAGGPTDDQDNDSSTCLTGGVESEEASRRGSAGEGQTPFTLYPEAEIWRKTLSETRSNNKTDGTGVILLLKTVKVPPGYKKVVTTRFCGELDHSLLLFTPQLERRYDLILPDGAIEGESGSSATVVIENHGLEPVHLRKGTVLGTVIPVEEVTPEDCLGDEEMCGSGVAETEPSTRQPDTKCAEGVMLKMDVEPVTAGERDNAPQDRSPNNRDGDETSPAESERTRRLLQQLALRLDHVDTSQREELIGLITSFSDIFALDASELGTTTLVQHVIQTGDKEPIHQPVRRMPFAL